MGKGEVPVLALDTSRERGSDACSCTNPDSTFEHRRCMADTSYKKSAHHPLNYRKLVEHTELQLPSPNMFRRILNQTLGEIALYAADHIMIRGFPPLAYDTKCVVLHDRCTADSPK